MIGYYVHHQGLGHRNRATQIARELTVPVTGFSTLERPEDWPGEWVQLPPDLAEHPVDPTAHGVLHWAPLAHPDHRERMGIMADRLRTDLELMVTDTSAEVTLLARLMGVPTVVMAMRGDRTDRTHRAAYDAATALVAPWSRETAEPDWLQEWNRKTTFTGAISRFDPPSNAAPSSLAPGDDAASHTLAHPGPAPAAPAPAQAPGGVAGPRTVLVVWGRGGRVVGDAEIAAARAATPGWRWTVRTPDEPSPDLWRELHEATVVVTHGGNNAVAELSAARARAVVVAQPRPHDEQLATAAALDRAEICVGLDAWPEARAWPVLLERARTLGGERWQRWHHGDGARRAARALESVLRGSGW
ncbi:glycosyltransferase [Kocuria sp.]|uniref:glycosyltransferase n=1 Tax=Kocuria sp. TaxID=1871328 RepID=UPI0026DD035C|nr:glycosyltransferase [Kocuria sp.]MDO4920043.1 glycosyltransferase [Kocuria sp.]